MAEPRLELVRMFNDDPEGAKAAVLTRMTEYAGVMTKAARSFGMHRITLWKLIRDHGLRSEVARIRREVIVVYGRGAFNKGFAKRRVTFVTAT